MMFNVKMTEGKEWQKILFFAIPIFISSLFQQLYNSVDSIIVGNFLGDASLAAVSSSGNLIFLFTSFFIGCFSGAGVLVSKYLGEKNYISMKNAIHTDIAFGIISGLILTGLGVLLTPHILRWMNTDPEVLPESITYFRWYFILVIGVVLYNCFSGILQAIGNSLMPLIFLVISSLMNIGLDLLFIGVFNMGVEGASIATGISQLTSAFLCFLYLIRKNTIYQVEIKKIRIHLDMLKKILIYGIPSGIQNSVIGLANVVVQSNINTFGKDAMAGCGVYAKVEGFAFLPVTSFTLSLTTFTGQNLGAKEYDRAKKGARFGIITSVLLAESIGILTYFLMPYLAKIFSQTDTVIELATNQSRTISLFYFLLAFSHCVAAVQRGAGRAFIPMIIMLSVWCIFRVIYVNVCMAIDHNIRLLWSAYPLTWGISSVIYFFIQVYGNWIHGFEKRNQ
ncbi:MAG: MATE family efflux transporter [Acholeplasmatales bacterium]|nr:MATE family efflux transporter [Acholeplasmatales bacterium]